MARSDPTTAVRLSGVNAPHAACAYCQETIYQVDAEAPTNDEDPAGGWAALATGTSCPFRDNGGHAAYSEPESPEPRSGGDVGGDGQVSDAWSRRFVRKLDDGLFAVITAYFYVHDERMRTANPAAPGPVLMCQTEFARCRDPQDIGSDEEYCDYTYVEVADATPTEDAARLACSQLDPALFTWDGEAAIHYKQRY